ncbi:glycerol-3-phosphate 1-O-acyltransferase PlsY [Saccharicrinis sp. GN24d3]|uniref:glycerol-3-phosphate 1-O-acyltransferase PlsY n=1 Tax=Saccharicrinis sp. GN24d3 TaxID=3458416 RepID=UPI0040374C9D
MTTTLQIVFVIFSYLLGSIPTGYFLTNYYTGKNILEWGSGNIGSTNVRRVAGKRISVVTQLLDMFKGFLPVTICWFWADRTIHGTDYLIYWVALAAILGHDFSIFLRFRGGKGVNTTLGASVLLAPFSVFIAVAIYFMVKWRFKFVSLGSLVLGVTMPLIEIILRGGGPTFYYLLVCTLLIFMMHKSNIKRLLNSNELTQEITKERKV